MGIYRCLYKPDFITGCETWLSQVVFDSEVLPESYRVYRTDRNDCYGGTLIGLQRQYQFELLLMTIVKYVL